MPFVRHKRCRHYFMGCSPIDEIVSGVKLPSNRQVLGLFLHHHHEQQQTLQESATSVAARVTELWDKASIPCQDHKNLIPKVKKMYREWEELKKHSCDKRGKSSKRLEREEAFQDALEDLFDVARRDAESIMKNEEDKQFLRLQRCKGRPGTMAALDKAYVAKQQKVAAQQEAAGRYRDRQQQEKEALIACVSFDSSSAGKGSDSEDSDSEYEVPLAKRARRTRPRSVLTPELVGALDRTATSDRAASHILRAVSKSSTSPEECAVSRRAIAGGRNEIRQKISEEYMTVTKNTLKGKPVVVHFDGKLLPGTTTTDSTQKGKKKDMVPVVASDGRETFALQILKLDDGKGVTQATGKFQKFNNSSV